MDMDMEERNSHSSADDLSSKTPTPDSKKKNVAEVTDKGELDKRQTDDLETKTDTDTTNTDDKGDINVSKQNEESDSHVSNEDNEDKKDQDTRIENAGNEPAENGLANDAQGETDTLNGHQNDDKIEDNSEIEDSLVIKTPERTEPNESDSKETVEIHSEPTSNVMNGELLEETGEEDKIEPVSETTENEIGSEKIQAVVEEADDTEINADDQNQRDTEDEAETYLVQHEAEKQVMHELIDETIVLEKDIGSLQTQLESTEKETNDLQTQVDKLNHENETQKTKIEHLEVELKEAKMGDGEQRRILEESQQRVQDLEGQLKRMVTDDEEKSKKLAKAEKDVLELTEKCRHLESESGENQQSKTCVLM